MWQLLPLYWHTFAHRHPRTRTDGFQVHSPFLHINLISSLLHSLGSGINSCSLPSLARGLLLINSSLGESRGQLVRRFFLWCRWAITGLVHALWELYYQLA